MSKMRTKMPDVMFAEGYERSRIYFFAIIPQFCSKFLIKTAIMALDCPQLKRAIFEENFRKLSCCLGDIFFA